MRPYEPAPLPPDELARLQSLQAYDVLDTAAEAAFDDLTVLAGRMLGAPIALISFVDAHRQWFKSRTGLDVPETPREWAFCAHAILGDGVLEVPDTAADPRFAGNPLVVGEPHVRFYAGAPLVAPGGEALGTLCVLDHRPRTLDAEQRDTLLRLSRQVVHLLELRRAARERHEAQQHMRERDAELQRLALVASRTHNVVILADPNGLVTWVNAAFTRLTGYEPHEVIGRKPGHLLQFERTDPAARQALDDAVAQRRAARVHILNRSKHGHAYWIDVDLQPQFGTDGSFLGFVSIETDITELVMQRERAQALFEALPVGVLVQDRDERIVQANAAAAALAGLAARDLVGADTRGERWHNVDADGRPLPDAARPVRRVLDGSAPVIGEVLGIRSATGERRWVRVSCAPLHAADGGIDGVISCVVDDTDERLRRQLLDMAVNAARIAIWHWRVDRDEIEVRRDAAEAMGLYVDPVHGEVLHAPFWPGVHRDDADAVRQALHRHEAQPHTPFRAEYRLRGAQGDWRWLLALGAATERDTAGRALRMSGVAIDITERKRSEDALRRAATTDALTGLPNRAVLRERLEQSLAAARRHGHFGALLFLDLDHFKRINDSYGHATGDALLRAVGQRLGQHLRAEDTLARMGGDELMVLLPQLAPHAGGAAALAQQVATKLQHALRAPFMLDGGEFATGASIGSTVFPKTPVESADDLIREADTAMYEAKGRSRGSVQHFESSMQAAVSRRLSIERDLQRALARGEFELHLQGKWRPGGELAGAEALLRWTAGGALRVGPAEFIPVAEDSGQIVSIGRWVLEQACAAAKTCARDGRPLPVAVNVSPRQFRDAGFAADLRSIVDAAGLSPDTLTLELTEGMLLDDTSARLMTALAAQGFRVSIDDFGTGYSSLMYLKKLPVHELKIDRVFVRDIAADPDDAAIVQAVLAIARRFRIDTVAEGVETPAQAQFLVAHGCTLLQGYLFGPPVPVDGFDAAGARRALPA